ncbi:unnamed protein product [Protopolystoma xenopodis]|uniref:Uncharacterized protein n=1 Tax=Protopolystoma xenopodis TaxID=117903 RepID=A0A3S5B1G1_9PLAT|nr:unnamed protein product [Protopolystoma xenopodis]
MYPKTDAERTNKDDAPHFPLLQFTCLNTSWRTNIASTLAQFAFAFTFGFGFATKTPNRKEPTKLVLDPHAPKETRLSPIPTCGGMSGMPSTDRLTTSTNTRQLGRRWVCGRKEADALRPTPTATCARGSRGYRQLTTDRLTCLPSLSNLPQQLEHANNGAFIHVICNQNKHAGRFRIPPASRPLVFDEIYSALYLKFRAQIK